MSRTRTSRASRPKAAPRADAGVTAPAAPATSSVPRLPHGFSFIGAPDGVEQDPVQAAMDEAVAKHNAAELERLAKGAG